MMADGDERWSSGRAEFNEGWKETVEKVNRDRAQGVGPFAHTSHRNRVMPRPTVTKVTSAEPYLYSVSTDGGQMLLDADELHALVEAGDSALLDDHDPDPTVPDDGTLVDLGLLTLIGAAQDQGGIRNLLENAGFENIPAWEQRFTDLLVRRGLKVM